MSLLWSPSTRGFYDDEIHGPGSIPGDVVSVTPARHAELIEAQASEAPVEIVASDTGTPVMSRNRTWSDAERRDQKLAVLRAERARRIEAIADTQQQVIDLRSGGADADQRASAIDAVIAAGAAIADQIDAASGTTLEDFDVADDTLWERQQ